MNRRSFLISSMASVPAIMFAGTARKVSATSMAGLSLPLSGKKTTPVDAETIYGKVRGYALDGVSIFRGVTYGGPTEGQARFLPPSKPEKWSGLYDASVNGQRCVQGPGVIFTDALIGAYFGGGRPDREELSRQVDSENCLNLNVLTKGLSGRRPVMVYIHGALTFGVTTTELADTMVRACGVTFRSAHHACAAFVRSGYDKASLREAFKETCGRDFPLSDEEIDETLDPARFVAVRKTPGGPAPGGMVSVYAAVEAGLAGIDQALTEMDARGRSAAVELAAAWARL